VNAIIKFKLIKQQFLELIKKEQLVEAIKFSRENFKEFTNVDEIQEIMILTAIRPDRLSTIPKYKVKAYNNLYVLIYYISILIYYIGFIIFII